MHPTMQQHVARQLCFAAATDQCAHGPVCPHCRARDQEAAPCTMWRQFMREAAAAIEAVRDFAMLSARKRPRGDLPPLA